MEKNNNFETIRNELRLDNRAFSRLLDIHETQYTKLKNGTYPVGAKTVNKIKDALPKYNIKWILNNELPKYNTENKNEIKEAEPNNIIHSKNPNNSMKLEELEITVKILTKMLSERDRMLEEKDLIIEELSKANTQKAC